MNAFAKSFCVLSLTAICVACGGGGGGGGGGSGGDGSQPPQPIQSAAGIWNGQLSISGSIVNDVGCLITEAGEGVCVLYQPATSTIVGGLRAQISVANGNQLGGSGTAYALPGYVLIDGSSTVAGFTVTGGTVSTRSAVELTFSILGSTGVLSANFDSLYDQDSSRDVVAGSYSDFEINQAAASFFINDSGVLSGHTASGCTLVGQVGVINPVVNGYSIDIAISNCPGVNGSYSGLALATDSATNNQVLLFGVFNNSAAILGAPKKLEGVVTSSLKLLASDGDAGDAFGNSVSTDGLSIAVGANLQEDFAVDSGAVYLFATSDQVSWSQQAKIKSEDSATGDIFGSSVDVDGNTVIVSARLDDDNGVDSGSAYVFLRDAAGAWRQESKLRADDGASGDSFGFTSAISADTTVIGAGFDDVVGSNSGSAYVFSRDAAGNWSQETQLIPTDAEAGAWFGDHVAIQSNTIVVGAPRDGGDGAAYVFERDLADNWTETSKLAANDLLADARFGKGFAIDGDTIIVGAFGDDVNGTDSGSAYVFTKDITGIWNLQAKLAPSDGSAGDLFAFWVDLAGDTAVVGARFADGLIAGSGAAYIFTRDGSGNWAESSKIVADDGAPGDLFGRSVSIKDNTVVVGAPGDDDSGSDSGSVYVFRLDELM